MSKETRVALLLGLGLIVAFGVILSEIKGVSSARPKPTSTNAGEFTNYALQPAVDEIMPHNSAADNLRTSQVPQLAKAPAKQPAAARYYTVRPNDSLSKIARNVYGPDGERLYKRIYEANRHILRDEATVRVGQVLVIPPIDSPDSIRPWRRGIDRPSDSSPARYAWRQ